MLLFDDSWLHSAHNGCDSERVVFQLVFVHPQLVQRLNVTQEAVSRELRVLKRIYH